MLTATQNNTTIRNYLVAAVSIIMLSAGVSDLFQNPSRLAQQDKIDQYSRAISAGLVSHAKTSLR